MSDLHIPTFPDATASATPMRLPLPLRYITRQRAGDQPCVIGRWLEAKVSNGDYDRLNCAEREDLRTAALLLESWALPTPPPPRSWLERVWRRVGL